MNDRQKQVLSAVVELYTKSALPIGSQALLEHSDLGVSSATLRSDMVLLEEEGYLYQPHVSAGRIPTDAGYRIYVEEMMGDKDLSREDQRHLQKELLSLQAKHTRLGRTTAKLPTADFQSFGKRWGFEPHHEHAKRITFTELADLCGTLH